MKKLLVYSGITLKMMMKIFKDGLQKGLDPIYVLKKRDELFNTVKIKEFLSNQDESYLKKCFIEVEDFRKNGTPIEGEIQKLNNQFFNNNPTTLFIIGELIYREIAVRHFGDL